jgi:hypothetical protein
MDDISCFKNELNFMNSVSALTVIVPFLLGISNDGEAHSEE